MFSILINYHEAFLRGLLVTGELVVLVALIGIPLGVVAGVVGARFSPVVAVMVRSFHFFSNVVPVLVFLFWLHYPLQSLMGVAIDPFWTTVLALSIINLILTADLVCRELELFSPAYREVGITLGLSKVQLVRFVELPILLRRIVPQLLINQATILQYTLLASFISVPELFRVAQNINSQIYRPVEIYSLLVLFFLLLLGPLHGLVWFLKKKYAV